jgi:hypothetical protein
VQWRKNLDLIPNRVDLCFTIASTLTLGHTQPIKCIHKEPSLGINQCGHADDHSYPVPRPRLGGAIQQLSPYILMAWCISQHRPCLQLNSQHLHSTSRSPFCHNITPCTATWHASITHWSQWQVHNWKHHWMKTRKGKSCEWYCKKVHYLIHSSYRTLFLHLQTSVPLTWKSIILDSQE